jgi:hypothetical protein
MNIRNLDLSSNEIESKSNFGMILNTNNNMNMFIPEINLSQSQSSSKMDKYDKRDINPTKIQEKQKRKFQNIQT